MNWNGGLVEWLEGGTAFISVVFSWLLPEAYQRAAWLKASGYHVRAGGPAVSINPEYLGAVAEIGGNVPALEHHNPDATFTSRGCIRHCKFCIVPKIEPDYIELDDWPVKPIVCDNNILAASDRHFNSVIDKLKSLHDVDFNQGLDARLLSKWKAERLAELDLKFVRLAWDHIGIEGQYLAAFQLLIEAGVPARNIRTYVLIGFNDTPAEALYRLETVKKLGARPNPMRYQPLDATKKNSYIAPGWTERQLRDYMRYWSRLRWLEHVPFEEYQRV